ncbi:hypothetical protein NSS93_06015 [Niallia sp. FSL K6-0077]
MAEKYGVLADKKEVWLKSMVFWLIKQEVWLKRVVFWLIKRKFG